VVTEFSAPSASSTALTRLNTFTWGLDLGDQDGIPRQSAGGVGGLLMQTPVSSGVIERASYDGNGNIVAWTKSTATAPTSRSEYDAFGNTVVSEGASPSAFGFSTKMQDSETGLYYYGYRFYDPVTGRWPSRDLIEEKGGLNLYAFVENNGIKGFDYLGKIKTGDEIKVKCADGQKAGTIKISDYSITSMSSSYPSYGAVQATLDMKFTEDSQKCGCKGGRYRWYQTVVLDDLYGNTPYPDDGSGKIAPPGPSLAPSYDLHFRDRPSNYNFDTRTLKLHGRKLSVKFETELQCFRKGKAETQKTIKWGFWLGVDISDNGLY
jgi:RHS repeat-associated protein